MNKPSHTSTNHTMAREKAKVLGTLAMAYDKLYFYDDNQENIEQARAMGIKSYQITNLTLSSSMVYLLLPQPMAPTKF